MAIELTRNQVLDLMKDLEPGHWLQELLLVELADFATTSLTKKVKPLYSSKISETLDKLASEAPVNAPKDELQQCNWQTYGHRCTTESHEDFCKEHRRVCRESGCNNMADHGCPCELQFVCGAALCSTHTSCSDHYRR